jgi:Protein of unknown function (DUF1393).
MIKESSISIYSTGFWASAAAEFHNLKSLVFAGLTIALGTVLCSIYIPVGVNLRITFVFLVLVFGSMLFGPVVGLATGLTYDLISFLLFPSGVFFPGYTLSTMLEFFIYGLFLYRSQISVLRIFLMKLIVDFAIHVGLGSLWSKILFGKGYYYYFAKSIIKNTIMLPIEVIMIVILLQIFLPVLVRESLIPKQKGKYIPFI